MKTCSGCKIEKPLEAFHIRSDTGGRVSRCIECKKIDDKKRWPEQYSKSSEHRKIKQKEAHAKNRVQRNERSKRYRNSITGKARFLWLSARKRALDNSLEFNLTYEIIELLLSHGKCARSGLPFDLNGGGTRFLRSSFGPSIDRRDNKKGYTFDNIQLVCNMYNMGKSQHEELDFIAMCIAVAERNSQNENAIKHLEELRNA